MLTRLAVRWHRKRTGHTIRTARVSVPSWDLGACGILWVCEECKPERSRTWAL